MQTRMAKPILWMGVVVCAVVLGVVNPGRVAAGNNKVDICHFQEENDSWKLLSLPQSSAAAHLEHHDDAIPGGTTAQSGTDLDAECVKVAVTCPCGNASNIVSSYNMLEFDGPQIINTGIEPDVVFYNASDSLDSIPHHPLLVLNANTSFGNDPSTTLCIYRMTNEIGTLVLNEFHLNISLEQVESCREDIIAIIGQIANQQP